MESNHSQLVKNNFEQKAAEYDSFMLRCVPDYDEMLNQLIDAIPHGSAQKLSICDLGSGTGNVTHLLAQRFTNSTITCVDVSPMMVDLAKTKLGHDAIDYQIGDFNSYHFNQSYDIISSSLALHHLVSDEDKKAFYKKIYQALKPGGIFINADIVIGHSKVIEEHMMELWKEWLRNYHSEEALNEMVINRYYEEDRPTSITNHILWMNEIGFEGTDVIWKKNKSVVYCGMKK